MAPGYFLNKTSLYISMFLLAFELAVLAYVAWIIRRDLKARRALASQDEGKVVLADKDGGGRW